MSSILLRALRRVALPLSLAAPALSAQSPSLVANGQPLPAGVEQREAVLPDGVRLRFVVAGDPAAPPVVLLHGLTDSWYSFARVLPALATRFRVYALDQRGHGGSDRPAHGYTMPEMARDVVGFLDAQRIARAAVVGHSMGSFVARRVALDAPERVTRLVLVGSGVRAATDVTRELPAAFAPLPDTVSEAFAREWQLSTVHAPVPADFMERVVLECRRAPARVWRTALAGMLAEAPATADAAPRMPTLLVSGDQDAPFPVPEQDALARTWPAARLVRYAGVGHAPHWEAPDRFVADVMSFLAR